MTRRPANPAPLRPPTHCLADPHPIANRKSPTASPPHPRGSIYLPVLLVGSILATLAVGGLVAVRSHARSAQLAIDASEARLVAAGALEAARATVRADPAWRSNRTVGNWFNDIPLGNGTFSVSATTDSGTLDPADDQPVILTVSARVRSARQTLTATLSPDAPRPVTALSASLASATSLTLTNATISGTNQRIATNGALAASLTGNNISVPAEAALTITGLGFTAGTTPLAATRTFPNTTSFLDPYLDDATPISYSSLPSGNGGRILNRILLSPASNPYGTPNPDGIYLIDCAGGKLTIQDSRLVATLLVRNASAVVIQNSVHWIAASNTAPALLTNAPLTVNLSSTNLSEASAGTNFNPAGTPFPYPEGTSDSDTTDSYGPTIRRLLYTSSSASLSGNNSLHQVLSNGPMTVTGTLSLLCDYRHFNEPPSGFSSSTFSIRPGAIE